MNRYQILKDIPTAWTDHIVFAKWIVTEKQPETIVDLGVDYGYSLFSFAIPEIGHVYGVDTFNGDSYTGIRNTYDFVLEKQKQLELNNITIIKENTNIVVSTWDKPIDILHIDTVPTYNEVKLEFYKWLKFVKDDGVILLHDTMEQGHPFEVKQFFEEIDLPKTNFENCHGLGVVSRDSDLIDRIKNQFNLK